MRRAGWARAVAIGVLVTCGFAFAQAPAQTPDSAKTSDPTSQPVATSSAQAHAPASDKSAPAATPDQASATIVTGGRLHGVVKSGNIPLPGVTVTAQNTLTGKKYSTTTDITGAWSMTIPQNGRYVIRTQFAAFAPGSQEALLNATSHDQTVNFALDAGLARGGAGTAAGEAQRPRRLQPADAIRQLAGNGAREPEPDDIALSDTETAAATAGVQRRGAAVDRGQLRLQRRFGRHQWPVGPGEPVGRRGYGPDSRRHATAYAGGEPWQASFPAGGGALRWAGGGGGFGGGGFGGGGGGSVAAASAAVVAAVDAATSAASIPASRTAPSSGSAATRR